MSFVALKWSLLWKIFTFIDISSSTNFAGPNDAYIFNASKDNSGCYSIVSLDKLLDPEEGFLVNDACIVVVGIFVYKSAYEKKVHGSVHLTFESQTEPLKVEDQCPNLDSLSSVCLEPTKDPDTEFMFAALGRVIYFLKTREVSDMNMKTCKEFQLLWDRLEKFKFDLTWLEPYVQSALGMKSFLEKAMEVEKLKESVVVLKLETKRLTAKLVAAEENLDNERDLLKANGVEVGFFSKF